MKKLLFISTVALLFASCEGAKIRYEVSGSASRMNVTYANKSGGTEQAYIGQGWSYEFTEDGDGQYKYISAQNAGGSGSVTVKIISDGHVLKTASSSGAYCVASCWSDNR